VANRAARLALGILIAALACVPTSAAGQRRRKGRPPASLPSNLPPARPPPPSSVGADRPAAKSGGPASRPATSLIPGVSNELALAGAGGLVLLLVILMVARRRRLPPRVAQPMPAPRGAAGQALLAKPERRPERRMHDTPAPPPGRKRKATALATTREASQPALELRPEQTVLFTREGGAPSLYDTLAALGPDLLAVRCLRQAAVESLDSLTWAATVKDCRPQRLARLATTWTRQVALERAAGWLRSHPLVQGGNLEVQVPGSLEPSDLANLTLTQRDGLGVSLGGELGPLLDHARAALARAFTEQPMALLAASSALGQLLPKEAHADHEEGYPPHALSLLVGGMTAFDWAVQAGLSKPGMGNELRDALREHTKLVGTPVPAEGSVAHALEVLGGGKLEGTGMLLAAVAGAAFSSSTVILRVSKRIGEIKANPLLAAFARLGGLACAALDDESSPDHTALMENQRFLVGEPLLEREVKRAAALCKDVEKLAREPIWKGGPGDLQSPDLALVTLHEAQMKQAFQQAVQARERLADMLDRLAHPGGSGEEETIGHRRLGYVLAGLGAPLLRSASTELLSAGREAMAMTAAMAAAKPVRPRK
jgi:hypothetical protein